MDDNEKPKTAFEKISAGMRDAIAFAGGDASRGTMTNQRDAAEALKREARYTSAIARFVRDHNDAKREPRWSDLPRYLASLPAATEQEPVADKAAVEAECARLLAAYLRKEIGSLMQQAEHWAENSKPLAVHHRLMKADDYFQILVLMERDTAKGWQLPFDEIRRALDRPEIHAPGTYPPSKELYRYRDPAFVTALTHPAPSDQEKLVGELADKLERLISPHHTHKDVVQARNLITRARQNGEAS